MKQYLVVGLGNFGSTIAKSLLKENYEVLVIDKSEEKVNRFKDEFPHVIEADTSNRNVLESIGIGNFDVGIITMRDNNLGSILSTLHLKEFGVSEVVTRASTEMHAKVLERVGADKIVFPERDMGKKITQYLISANINVIDYINFTSDHSIVEINAPKFMEGKSLNELELRAEFNVNVIAIRRGDNINISPGGRDVIHKGDVLVVLGENEKLDMLK